ncbi:Chaperone protein DnaJ [Cytospora mali]|uniref:Chaperone protein DnaJ n=1 Tax=Cytospora mali TaxID=578113 RepID=A0A194VVT0_CYTMA|nr:Chaperone protein DnaJ [Valsa mali]
MLPLPFPDLYAVLGLAFGAFPSRERIRSAYLQRAQHVHPDKGGFHDVFLKVKHAYDVLSDPNRRAEYDERYEAMHTCGDTMPEYVTTAVPQPSQNLTPTPTSRPSAPTMTVPDFSRQQPVDHSQLPIAFHPDPIEQAYRRGMPHSNPQAAHHFRLIGGMDHDSFRPHIVDFLNLAALDGLRRYHNPAFQASIDQRCRAIGRSVRPVTRAEAERRASDAMHGWAELRAGLLFVVVFQARPHLLLPDHPFMRETYRLVATLGYFWESLRGLKETIVERRSRVAERGGLLLLADDDRLVSGALKAHRGTGRDMVEVLERLKGLAGELACVGDGDPKREVLLEWMCGEMRSWPRLPD